MPAFHLPIWDIAHLAHVEMLTPRLEESVWFFTDLLGMSVSGEHKDSVFLRAYDDYEHHSLVLTANPHPGIGHYAWRMRSQDVLERRVSAIAATPHGLGWTSGSVGHGPAYSFIHPGGGHRVELYFETEKYRPADGNASALKNTASRFPGRGANVRRLDHLNILAKDVRAFRDFQLRTVGGMLTETILFENDDPQGVWFAVNSKTYDLAVTNDHLGMDNRLHHVTYAVNSREEVLIAADIFLENGIFIETGPHKHAVQQTFFLYVYEPGGNRVEIANATARLVLDPDYETVVWTREDRAKGQAWGLETVKSFHTRGTPMPEHLTGRNAKPAKTEL